MSDLLVSLKEISKKYGENLVVDNISLEVKRNQFITLLGPSGCGKTTILRMIAGFEDITDGVISFEGKDISSIPAHMREINTVFQNYALFPHLNVFENIAFGLRLKKENEESIKERVYQVLNMVKLSGYEDRNISELSGGQQQRVALARAIVNRPKLLLLDEPLSALDLKLRQEMQYEIKDLQNQLGITFIFVTHDQEEALTMSDQIIVMNEGKILQIGTPEDIYNEPQNRFVASFIGESNIVKGKYLGNYEVEFLGAKFECVDDYIPIGGDTEVVIRPEDLEVVSPDKGQITGIVDDIVFKGVHYEVCVIVQGKELIVHTLKSPEINEQIGLQVGPEEIHLMRV
jgi:spermidine/putrescine transport system ATP-binding protein